MADLAQVEPAVIEAQNGLVFYFICTMYTYPLVDDFTQMVLLV